MLVRCRHCGDVWTDRLESNLWEIHKHLLGVTNYCPRCGNFLGEEGMKEWGICFECGDANVEGIWTGEGVFVCIRCIEKFRNKGYSPYYKDPRVKWKSIPPKVCPHCGQEVE